MGAMHLSGAVNLGRTEVDIERSITLGPAVSTQRGATAARQIGVDVDLAWTLDALETVRHGPAIGLSWPRSGGRRVSGERTRTHRDELFRIRAELSRRPRRLIE